LGQSTIDLTSIDQRSGNRWRTTGRSIKESESSMATGPSRLGSGPAISSTLATMAFINVTACAPARCRAIRDFGEKSSWARTSSSSFTFACATKSWRFSGAYQLPTDSRSWMSATLSSRLLTRALTIAAMEGHLECVQLLVKKGRTQVHEKDNLRRTALTYAAEKGHLDCVQFWVKEGGAKVNDKDIDGKTALMYAAEKGHLECVQFLVKEGGASVNLKDNAGKMAVMLYLTAEIRSFLQHASVAPLIIVFIHGKRCKKSTVWLSLDSIRLLRDMLIETDTPAARIPTRLTGSRHPAPGILDLLGSTCLVVALSDLCVDNVRI